MPRGMDGRGRQLSPNLISSAVRATLGTINLPDLSRKGEGNAPPALTARCVISVASKACPPHASLCPARSTVTTSSGVLAIVPSLAGWYSTRSVAASTTMRR